jgi:hypothetical protein
VGLAPHRLPDVPLGVVLELAADSGAGAALLEGGPGLFLNALINLSRLENVVLPQVNPLGVIPMR